MIVALCVITGALCGTMFFTWSQLYRGHPEAEYHAMHGEEPWQIAQRYRNSHPGECSRNEPISCPPARGGPTEPARPEHPLLGLWAEYQRQRAPADKRRAFDRFTDALLETMCSSDALDEFMDVAVKRP
jgi:hypothetical protein